jgi:hypothetical protein
MITRRRLMTLASLATAGTLATATLYSSNVARKKYDEAVRSTWRHADRSPASERLPLRELVRYATLAPSSHNTQCWKFRLAEKSIAILPDLQRRCPVVDPDDHHLFVSLGCATENLIQAAPAHGLRATMTFDLAHDHIQVQLEPGDTIRSPFFEAIPNRQSTRTEYDGKALSNGELNLLERAGAGNGTRVLLLTHRNVMEQALEFVLQGNTSQLNDPAFVRELESWIRFSDAEAVRRGDGLFTRTTGNPTVPSWIGRLLFKRFLKAGAENDKYARHLRSSAGLAVFVSERNDREQWIESGRCFQRFALQATALGIRTAHLNQPVEVAALRPQFSSFLTLGNHRPDLVVRFGRGPEMPRSLRRPVDAVLV